jgi:DNA invertase Pin-like site-specific DNA recombinase
MRSLLAAMGVTLRSVSEPIDDTSTGKFMELIFSGIAELDNNIRAERSTSLHHS